MGKNAKTMDELRRLIEDIQTTLYSLSDPAVDELRRLAAEYDIACRQANDRLRECGELLGRGLRSEAIQRCEKEPNLIDVVATLDFPEMPQWRECLAANELAGPPALMTDVAAELNEAYSVAAPLEHLLKRHRLLAISRATLLERVRTLRRIAQLDSQNSAWQADLREYEQARLLEIDSESRRALRERELTTLKELHQELLGTWLLKPSKQLVDRVKTGLYETARDHAREEMKELATSMNRAFSELDVEEGRRLRARWEQCAGLVPLDDDSPLATDVLPTLDWLAEQDELNRQDEAFQHDLEQLRKEVLRRKPRRIRLEKAIRDAGSHGFAIPEDLSDRAEEVLGRLNRLARLLRWLSAVAGLLCIVAACYGGWMLFAQIDHSRSVVRHEAEVSNLIDTGQLELAQTRLEEIEANSPQVFASAPLQDLAKKLKALLADDAERHSEFQSLLADALSRAEVCRPNDVIDLVCVKEAAAMVRTDAEREQLGECLKKAQEIAIAAHTERNRQFRAMLDEYETRFKDLRRQADGSSEEQLALLATLESEFKSACDSASQPVDQEVLGTAETLQASIDTARKTIETEVARRKDEALVTAAVGNLSAFASALERYAEKFSETERAKDFATVAADRDLWNGVDAWNELTNDWNQLVAEHARRISDSPSMGQYDYVTPSDAERMLARIDELSERCPGFPRQAQFDALRPYFQSIVQRGQMIDGDELVQLRSRYTGPLMVNLWTVVEKGTNKRYYSQQRPIELASSTGEEKKWRVKVVSSRTAGESRTMELSLAAPPIIAPHSVAAGNALKCLAELNSANWDSTFFRIVEHVLLQDHVVDGSASAAAGMEPVVQVALLKRTLQVACRGSHPLQIAYGVHLERLDRSGLDLNAQWTDPDDADASRARALAEIALDGFSGSGSSGGYTDRRDAIKRAREQWRKPIEGTYTWVGWLRRRPDGEAECVLPDSASGSGKLLVVRKANDRVEYVPVEELRGGAAEVKTAERLPQGLPVYLEVSLPESSTPDASKQ